jgi:hypothetical protein
MAFLGTRWLKRRLASVIQSQLSPLLEEGIELDALGLNLNGEIVLEHLALRKDLVRVATRPADARAAARLALGRCASHASTTRRQIRGPGAARRFAPASSVKRFAPSS